MLKIKKPRVVARLFLWEHTGSNRGPSACKADALNQLSYAPFVFWECKDRRAFYIAKYFIDFFIDYIFINHKSTC